MDGVGHALWMPSRNGLALKKSQRIAGRKGAAYDGHSVSVCNSAGDVGALSLKSGRRREWAGKEGSAAASQLCGVTKEAPLTRGFKLQFTA